MPTHPLTERQLIALGFRPRTLAGWLFWLRYWSPPGLWLEAWRLRRLRRRRSSCPLRYR
jgi:hypothetical protein